MLITTQGTYPTLGIQGRVTLIGAFLMISSLTFVIFTVYLIEKSLYFIGKHISLLIYI